MADRTDRLAEARALYARMMAAGSNSPDPRLERIFALIPREDFLPQGPWHVLMGQHYVKTPSADPIYLYQNTLVALDPKRGINNGEPLLHAAWIGAVAPRSGETIVHIGAGAGYYTAIVSMLVLPGGKVLAYEIDPQLAEAASKNLARFANVTVVHADAVKAKLTPSDIIYVNAGVVAPPVQWLHSLKFGGRLMFPWRPSQRVGLAVLATRNCNGFSVRIVGSSWFIPCSGASDERVSLRIPSLREARKSRSIVFASERAPDESATAVYPDLWFSSDDVSAQNP